MRKLRSAEFTGESAWDSVLVERFDAATVKLHWTDRPYIWHVNDGPEVFAVLDGTVDMHVRADGEESVVELNAGDIFHVEAGDEHVAHPRGEARVLVVERPGSV